MFSGIIQSTGTVLSIETTGTTKKVRVASSLSAGFSIDQSIAHDGVCLTVTSVEEDAHTVDIIKETWSKTTFASLREGQILNLEKSLSLQSLVDGHLVQGHVDTTLTCLHRQDEDGSWKFKFNLPAMYKNLVIPHGSICLNGVSLTIAQLTDDAFEVAIIPYTHMHTNFQWLSAGKEVNVEFDLIGKYLARQYQP